MIDDLPPDYSNDAKAGKQEAAKFEAHVKSISIKSLVSGDKEAQILLRFIPEDELLDKLNRLHRADDFVNVTIENGK